ncbi:MAG: TRL-like family protein [Treponema sp.]|jgi:hypothetical protein|nr:TRL-like family protein [Treponema sp.]
MKRSFFVVALVSAVLFLAASCTTVNLPAALGEGTIGSRTGQASGTIILGLFGNADAGMLAAAANGGITRISTVDVQVTHVLLGLMTTVTTTVTGE